MGSRGVTRHHVTCACACTCTRTRTRTRTRTCTCTCRCSGDRTRRHVAGLTLSAGGILGRRDGRFLVDRARTGRVVLQLEARVSVGELEACVGVGGHRCGQLER
eukprot:6152733-Prymnesium_polylepis.1